MKFTYYGHSCFSIQSGGQNVLFDPFITPNELARHIKLEDIKADFILVTHGHGDHIADCVQLAKQTGAQVIAPYEVAEWLGKNGVENTTGMNHGGKKEFLFGTVKLTAAIHSSVMPDGSYGGNPAGFLVTGTERTFYYSGDTALTMDMQLIPRWAKPDFAVLCIGDNFTMGYEDAVQAAQMVQCTQVIGVHYDTFGLIKIDHQKANEAFTGAGLTLHLPGIGESIDL